MYINNKSKKPKKAIPVGIIFGAVSLALIVIGLVVRAEFGWWKNLDPSFFVFLCILLIAAMDLSAGHARNHERIWTITLTLSLICVLSWYVALRDYQSQGVVQMNAKLNLALLLAGFLLLPTVRKYLLNIWERAQDVMEKDVTAVPAAKDLKRAGRPDVRKSGSLFGVIKRWLIAEGLKYSLGLLLIAGVGIFLRFYHLGSLSPAGDEYRHLMAMKHYLAEGFYEYTDSHFVTYLLIIIRKITGSDSLWLLRLPFALFGSASIVMLYFIGRKMNKFVGLVAAYLFAFLPLSVGLSRYIRGYELEMFTGILGLLIFLSRPFRRRPLIWSAVMTAVLLGLCYLNNNAQFNATVYLLIIFSVVYLSIEYLQRWVGRPRLRRALIPALLAFGFAVSVVLIAKFSVFHVFQEIEDNYLYIVNYTNSDATWFLPLVPYFIILLTVAAGIMTRKSFHIMAPFFFVTAVTIFFYMFYFNAPRRFQVRYIYYIYPYLILMLATGTDSLYRLIRSFGWANRRRMLPIVCAVIFLAIFNPFKAVYFSLTAESGELDKSTQIARFDHRALTEYIDSHQIDVSKVITNIPGALNYYYDRPFANTANDKGKYLRYPDDQSFELFDKEKIFSLNGYWYNRVIATIKDLIRDEDIEYLIFSTPLQSKEFQSYAYLLTNKIAGLQFIDVIDANKTYGYYVFKVIR